MGQEIYLSLRKKGSQETYATLASVCGRGPLQDIVIENLSLFKNDQNEFVVSEEDIECIRKAITALAQERDLLFQELSKAMKDIEKQTLYCVALRDTEAIKEAQKCIACLEGMSDPESYIWEDFFLAIHLINLLSTAEDVFTYSGFDKEDPFRKEMEVVVSVSY